VYISHRWCLRHQVSLPTAFAPKLLLFLLLCLRRVSELFILVSRHILWWWDNLGTWQYLGDFGNAGLFRCLGCAFYTFSHKWGRSGWLWACSEVVGDGGHARFLRSFCWELMVACILISFSNTDIDDIGRGRMLQLPTNTTTILAEIFSWWGA